MRVGSYRGFTLVELLVTMAILAIVLVIGLPSFQDSIRSNRMATTSNEMMAALAAARSEAIRSTRGGGLCASDAAGTACQDIPDWGGSNGILIWTNADATSGFQPGDQIVRRIEGRSDVTIHVPAKGTGPDAFQILFNGQGVVSGPSDGSSRLITMTPTNCPSGRNLVRTLTMTQVGQATLGKENCA